MPFPLRSAASHPPKRLLPNLGFSLPASPVLSADRCGLLPVSNSATESFRLNIPEISRISPAPAIFHFRFPVSRIELTGPATAYAAEKTQFGPVRLFTSLELSVH